ncbi:unnamed protein product [Sphagnum jensenii]|uniref:Uncharacterized protein n=1 Tax=Sphagnum jensenii TaxID=128206 RepID=A0ABP1B715_9BRYO
MAALSGLRERQKTMRQTSCWSLERAGATSHNDVATRSVVNCCCGTVVQRDAGRCSSSCYGAGRCSATQRCSNNVAVQCNVTLELALLRRWALHCN